MAKICMTEKTALRQRWIENGLLKLMLQNKYEEITVTDLCCHLELSRRSFYRYFDDMDDVLDSLLNHTFQDLALPMDIVGMEEFQKGYDFWLQRRDLLDALHYSGLTDKLYEYTLRYTDFSKINKFMVEDNLQMDICRETGLFITSGFVSLVIAWHADGFRKTPEQMAQITARLLFTPILNK